MASGQAPPNATPAMPMDGPSCLELELKKRMADGSAYITAHDMQFKRVRTDNRSEVEKNGAA
jgi:hypothetical protein